jgi:hypothetical protein
LAFGCKKRKIKSDELKRGKSLISTEIIMIHASSNWVLNWEWERWIVIFGLSTVVVKERLRGGG